MWTLLTFALLSTVAASSYPPTSYNYMIRNMFQDLLPYELNPSSKQFLEKICLRHADNETFNNFVNVWSNLTQDMPTSTMQEAAKYLQDGETLKSLDVYCKLSPKLKTYSTIFLSALKPCVAPEGREEIDYHTNALTFASFLDYICFNSSEIVNTFLQNGGKECMMERNSELRQCSLAEQEDKIVNDIDKKISESTMTKEELKKARNDRECRVKKIFQTCVKKELDQCPSPSTSTFIIGLSDRFHTPSCNEHISN